MNFLLCCNAIGQTEGEQSNLHQQGEGEREEGERDGGDAAGDRRGPQNEKQEHFLGVLSALVRNSRSVPVFIAAQGFSSGR